MDALSQGPQEEEEKEKKEEEEEEEEQAGGGGGPGVCVARPYLRTMKYRGGGYDIQRTLWDAEKPLNYRGHMTIDKICRRDLSTKTNRRQCHHRHHGHRPPPLPPPHRSRRARRHSRSSNSTR